MSFVVKDSAGMMAFVVAVDDVDCREAPAVGAAVEVIIVDSDIFHLRTELLQIRTEENVHLTKIKHHDLWFQYLTGMTVIAQQLKGLERLLLQWMSTL